MPRHGVFISRCVPRVLIEFFTQEYDARNHWQILTISHTRIARDAKKQHAQHFFTFWATEARLAWARHQPARLVDPINWDNIGLTPKTGRLAGPVSSG
jgi:hypothetical protein